MPGTEEQTPPVVPIIQQQAPPPPSVEDDDDDDSDDGDSSDLSDAEKLAKKLIEEQHGSYRRKSPEARACRKLVHDVWKLRAKNTALRERVAGEGDVVLKKGPEVEALKIFNDLGVKPSELKGRLAQLEEAQAKLRDFEKNELFNDVADSLGYTGRGKKAFIRVAKKEGVEFQTKEIEVEKDGKKVKEERPFAKLVSETDDKWRELDVFVEKDLGDYLPAFQVAGSDDDQDDDGDPGSVRSHAPAKRFTPMVTQSRTTGASQEKAERGVVTDTLGRRYKLPEKAK